MLNKNEPMAFNFTRQEFTLRPIAVCLAIMTFFSGALIAQNSGAIIETNDYERAHSKYADGAYEEAHYYFTKAIEADPKDVGAHFYRGHTNIILKAYADAIQDFSNVIKISPDDSHAYFSRGNVRMEVGEFSAAISDYSKTIEIDNKFAEAYYQRALCKYEIYEKSAILCDDLHQAAALGYGHADLLIVEYCTIK